MHFPKVQEYNDDSNKKWEKYECELDLSDSCEMKSEANPLFSLV